MLRSSVVRSKQTPTLARHTASITAGIPRNVSNTKNSGKIGPNKKCNRSHTIRLPHGRKKKRKNSSNPYTYHPRRRASDTGENASQSTDALARAHKILREMATTGTINSIRELVCPIDRVQIIPPISCTNFANRGRPHYFHLLNHPRPPQHRPRAIFHRGDASFCSSTVSSLLDSALYYMVSARAWPARFGPRRLCCQLHGFAKQAFGVNARTARVKDARSPGVRLVFVED